MRVFDSMAAADQADREYWWSRSGAERLRELERLRQLNYGYGQGRPLPRFQPILRIEDMKGNKHISDRALNHEDVPPAPTTPVGTMRAGNRRTLGRGKGRET